MQQYANAQRRGIQIHAVPDAERAVVDGRKLPWGMLYSDRAPTPDSGGESGSFGRGGHESGPFGRVGSTSVRRRGTSRSRSKTAEPAKKEEDRIRAENLAAEDAIFGRLRGTEGDRKDRREAQDESRAGLREVHSNTAPTAQQSETLSGGTGNALGVGTDPTEVLLYGFGDEQQWAAIDFYERVSNGIILEDYDRHPYNHAANLARSYGRQAANASLSRAALRKKNNFAGGNHWIKVTFDSPEAADLATARSPHMVRGHLVYAEPYRGTGPSKDEAIFASNAGAQITNDQLPTSFSTSTLGHSSRETESSATASSATATGRNALTAFNESPSPATSSTLSNLFQRPARSQQALVERPSTQLQTTTAEGPESMRKSRISGVKVATLLPADQAMLPKESKPSWSLGGSWELIGTTVPRKDDGTFDHARANLWWMFMYWIDCLLGTDICGLKGD